MAKKLNSMPGYQARMPRQPHDLSQSTAFTSSTGMLLPIYYDMLHTGDELHFNAKIFSRLNPLNVASLADIDIHLDYFFVPLSVMYTPTTSIFYQTDDLISSSFANNNWHKDRFPTYDIDSYLIYLKDTVQGGVNSAQYKDHAVQDPSGSAVSFYTAAFDCVGKAAVRLCDLLGYSYRGLFDSTGTSSNPHTTPWFILAYKACYELYFRNDDREPKSYQYNIDKWFSQGTVGDLDLNLQYASCYKDYFNAVKVSPIGSSVSMLNGMVSWELLSKVTSYLNDGEIGPMENDGYQWPSSDKVTVTTGYNDINSENHLSASSIRQLFMVDKMLRVTGRASKDYESQFLAHFGIKIPHDDLHNITHIGHDMITMSPSPVVSSADTASDAGGSALGEVGGQGYVDAAFKKRTFKAPFHGVFMVIYHAQPRFRYFSGIDKLHDLSSPDKFWQPEYDRRGMQPIYGYEGYRDAVALSTYRYGWQFAYEQFKRKYDRVTLAFRNAWTVGTVNEYGSWVLSRLPYRIPYSQNQINGSADQSPAGSLQNFTDLLSTPHDLDTIMKVRYQSTWITDLTYANAHQLFTTDPFINDFRLNCTKVNFMSEFGEPELD